MFYALLNYIQVYMYVVCIVSCWFISHMYSLINLVCVNISRFMLYDKSMQIIKFYKLSKNYLGALPRENKFKRFLSVQYK